MTFPNILTLWFRRLMSKDRNLTLHTLSNYDYLISQASDTGYVNPDQLETLKSWRQNPQEWNP